MNNLYEEYLNNFRQKSANRPPSRYKQKLMYIKQLIREYVHENAALVDEIQEIEMTILTRQEERKYLLRKLCEYEPQILAEVQNAALKSQNSGPGSSTEGKKSKKRNTEGSERRGGGVTKPRRSNAGSKSRKKFVQPIPLDNTGRPIFPIELGQLTIHSLGDVVSDRFDFHCEDAIFPVGYVSTRIYGSLKDPTQKCVYTCKVSDVDDMPRFEIAADDNCPPIVGDTPDVCHSLLLQKINDSLSLNVVSTRPRGNDFFGLTHPTVLNLIQSCSGARKLMNLLQSMAQARKNQGIAPAGLYKWSKFEVSKTGDVHPGFTDAALSYDYLQRSISFCKYKMAPDVLQKPPDSFPTRY